MNTEATSRLIHKDKEAPLMSTRFNVKTEDRKTQSGMGKLTNIHVQQRDREADTYKQTDRLRTVLKVSRAALNVIL